MTHRDGDYHSNEPSRPAEPTLGETRPAHLEEAAPALTPDGVENGKVGPDDSTGADAETVDVNPGVDQDQTLTPPSPKMAAAAIKPPSKSGEDFTGKQLGEYLVLELIARGGMGVVFKARQLGLNRIVALKMIRSGALADDAEVLRFYAEAESAARLDHPGIVPIYDVGQVGGHHYFSMGYVEGSSLADDLRDGPLLPRRAAEIIRAVAAAVEYAHEQGIIHRDLKPANVLMDSQGRARVTDFGLAKIVEGDSDLTATGQVLGTPSYMAPEQAAGRTDTLDRRVDVYSLGAMLYCLLVGRPPFQAASPLETIKQVLEQEPVPPRLLNPEVNRDLETICLKCLEKDRSERFSTAQELVEELDRFLEGKPIRSRRVGRAVRAYRWCRRNPMTAAFSASIVLLIAVAVFAVVVANYASRAGQISDLSQELEERFAEPTLTSNYLESIEELLDRLQEISPERAETARAQFQQKFDEEVIRNIRQPKLENQASIESILNELEARGWATSLELQNQYRARLRAWETLFSLAPPFQDQPRMLTDVELTVNKDALLLPQPADQKFPVAHSVPTSQGCRGIVRLVAEFDSTWESAAEIGLILNAHTDGGYEFLLRALPGGGPQAARTVPVNRAFRAVREQGEMYQVEIRRNGIPLLKRSMSSLQLPPGSLRLEATRERGNLSFSVNDQPAIRFRDPFPLGHEQAGSFGLRWPQGTALLSLKGERQLRAESTSPLEEADELYDRGLYRDALDSYTSQTITTQDPEFRQEVRYKRGLCLMKLNQDEEADRLFEALMLEPGDRWPPLAGCWLWLIRLRQNRVDDADAIFTVLSSRADEYQFSQLAALIPAELREGILSRYLRPFNSLFTLFNNRPEIVGNARRAVEIDRFLSHDGRGDPLTQMELSRALRFEGDLTAALEVAREVALSTGDLTCMRHYSRLLRLSGDAGTALNEVNASIELHERLGPVPTLLIERARVFAALKRWDEAGQDVRRVLQLEQDGTPVGPEAMSYIYLMHGFLLARQGMNGESEQAWNAGFLRCRDVLNRHTTLNAESVNVMILAALSDRLTEADTRLFIDGLKRGAGESRMALLTAVEGVVTPAMMTPVFNKMWRTARGRRYAEEFAFETLTMRERLEIPLVLAAAEYIGQRAFAGQLSGDQEKLVWQIARNSLDRVLFQNRLRGTQFVQLALAWKGTTNILGWGGVAPTLGESLRAEVAYVLAHRYLRLGRQEQAVEFLTSIAESSQAEESLAKFAQEDLSLIHAGHGRINLRNLTSTTVSIRLKTRGEILQELELKDDQHIDVPPGEYEILPAEGPGEIEISPATMTIAVAGRIEATVVNRHQPESASE